MKLLVILLIGFQMLLLSHSALAADSQFTCRWKLGRDTFIGHGVSKADALANVINKCHERTMAKATSGDYETRYFDNLDVCLNPDCRW